MALLSGDLAQRPAFSAGQTFPPPQLEAAIETLFAEIDDAQTHAGLDALVAQANAALDDLMTIDNDTASNPDDDDDIL